MPKKKKQYKAQDLRFDNHRPIYQDTPTPEQMRKNVYEYETLQTKVQRARILTQTLMDTYLLKKQITEPQYDAGMKYYKLWRLSGLEPRTTSALKPVVSSNTSMAIGDSQGDCYVALQEARSALGKRLVTILDKVLLYNEPLKEWEKSYGVRAKTGMSVLIVALDTLADFWGIG